ncbi:MAG: ubiquinol cytochrome C oxidoreductase, partial [Bacteroidota bacterium]
FSTGVTFALTWLPMLRVIFEGQDYQWSQLYFGMEMGGIGFTPGFGFLLLSNLFFLILFASFYWQKNRNIWAVLLLMWVVHIFGNLLYNSLNIPTGDVSDQEGIPIAYLLVPLMVMSLGWIAMGIWKDRGLLDEEIPWSLANRKRIYFLLGLLPIQAVLFVIGEQNGTTDSIAVVMTMVQATLTPWVFLPQKN